MARESPDIVVRVDGEDVCDCNVPLSATVAELLGRAEHPGCGVVRQFVTTQIIVCVTPLESSVAPRPPGFQSEDDSSSSESDDDKKKDMTRRRPMDRPKMTRRRTMMTERKTKTMTTKRTMTLCPSRKGFVPFDGARFGPWLHCDPAFSVGGVMSLVNSVNRTRPDRHSQRHGRSWLVE